MDQEVLQVYSQSGWRTRRFGRFTAIATTFMVAAIIVISCGSTPTDTRLFGNQAVLEGDAYLSCPTECADHGQCGVAEGVGRYVLMSNAGPAGVAHNLALLEDTLVNIASSVDETVTYSQDGRVETVRYYQINTVERGSAWVAGWCISNQANPAQ